MTSEAPATEPENQESVFGSGYKLFLGIAGGLFAIIAIAIPMVIIASSLTGSGSTGAPPATGSPGGGDQPPAASVACLACHTSDGTDSVGPTWLGLAGSDRDLESGETVVADDAYLHESIVDPSAKIVAGFSPLMPEGYGDQLSEEEINELISYINSLG